MTPPAFAALVAAVLRRRFGVPADVPWPDGEVAAHAIGLGIAAALRATLSASTSWNIVTGEVTGYEAAAARAFEEASR